MCARVIIFIYLFIILAGGGGGGGWGGAVVFHLHSLFVFCNQLTTHCLKLLIRKQMEKKMKKGRKQQIDDIYINKKNLGTSSSKPPTSARYLSGPIPSVRRHTAVNKMCWMRR